MEPKKTNWQEEMTWGYQSGRWGGGELEAGGRKVQTFSYTINKH